MIPSVNPHRPIKAISDLNRVLTLAPKQVVSGLMSWSVRYDIVRRGEVGMMGNGELVELLMEETCCSGGVGRW